MSENIKTDLKQALKENDEAALLTAGISMRPMLREHRDMIVVERITRPLKANDVPAYMVNPNTPYVLHRILRVTDKGYIIRGDNLFRKEFVVDKQIIGVLKAFYRDGKYYNCKTSKKYRLYIFYIRASYPFRWLWKLELRPFLGRIKRGLFRVARK